MNKLLKLFCLFIFLLSAFLLLTQDIEPIEAAEVFPFNGIIDTYSVYIHNAANTKSSSNETELIYGTRVTVLESVTGKNTSNGNVKMYKIRYEGNKEGYITACFFTNVDANTLTSNASGLATYNDYCNTLVKGGFDKSYCPYLYYLHSIHPKWTFKADKVGYTLEKAAKEEEEKVSLQTGNPNYWYYENNVPQINESNYYFINYSAIASLMDPRNSLFDGLIYQFLNLEKTTDAMNDEALYNITGTSGNLRKYTKEFMTAANELEINALHLMVRSKQEGANKVGYAATTGTYTKDTKLTNLDGRTLDGFYNFYNIGSNLSDGYSKTVQRGLAYAAGYIGGTSYGRPWTTPEKAIIGGGEFIGNAYVKNGQNTNYFQKYNIATYAKSKKFGHQYMTNGGAPASEGSMLYSAYKAGKLENSAFEFVIPVYDNMPSDGYQASDKNINSSLSSITIDDKVINNFEPTILEYNYNAVTDSNTIKVGAKTTVNTSTVSGTGNYTFTNDKVKVTLTVKSEGGTSTTYIVNVTRVSKANSVLVEDIVSKMGVKVNNSIMYGISPDTSVSSLINTVTKNRGTAVVKDSKNKTKTSGSLATGDKISITGTNETKTYTIAVRGDLNGDGIVKINDLILVQSQILGKTKLTNEKYYAADTNYDNSIKINDLILVQSHILGKKAL